MAKICYERKNFQPKKLETIESINEIINEYNGVPLSLRQVYYQMVARNLIENTPENYDKIGDVVSDGRIAGLIDWECIEDRNRELVGHQTFESPEAAMNALARNYKIDLWRDQKYRPEVWVEKAAMEGVVGEICGDLRVNFFCQRGYNSQSEQWRAGRRFANYIHKGQTPIVFHLGDHDPSGIDMTRDNKERLEMFAGVPVLVQRLALNMDQVHRYSPPPNPAKVKDSRFRDYHERFGTNYSWELDALEPRTIQRIIADAVGLVRDEKLFAQAIALEEQDQEWIKEAAGGGKDDEETEAED